MPNSYNFADAQRLLIKPFERIEFVIIFVLITGLSQIVAYFTLLQPPFDLLWKQNQIQYAIVTGIIGGTLLGASQWLILRKYVSDWKWILVVAVSATFINTIQTTGNIWIEPLRSPTSDYELFKQRMSQIVLVGVIFCILSIGAILISGYLQWYVLRRYVVNARWWIFIPLIAILAGIIAIIVGSLPFVLGLLTLGLLDFNRYVSALTMFPETQAIRYVIALTVLPTTQAIGFCILKKKSVSGTTISQSPLALAPDIVNYWDIQRLKEKLYTSISRTWTTDITTSIGQLSYLVGVSHDGAIICYEPVNQDSTDNIDQTPLTKLASNFNSVVLTTKNLIGFAKFQVVFSPPSIVQIYSWRGIPLIWLGITAYTGIIGMSVLFAWLQAVRK